MKRFFLVFSILMIVFLVLTAGCLAAVGYAAVQTHGPDAPFIGGWGITAIPYSGSRVTYPKGDLFILKKVPAESITPDTVILFVVADRSGRMSGLVSGRADGVLKVEGAAGVIVDVPGGDVVAAYYPRSIPGFVDLLYKLKSPVAIAVFAVVLIASIVLWRALPRKGRDDATLSESDGDIASNLY